MSDRELRLDPELPPNNVIKL